jgi:hypothetical protein
MSYLNLSRTGVRSTLTVNPQSVLRDISAKARRLSPTAMPLMNFLLAVGKGRPAGSKKVETRRRYAFDHLDFISAAAAGTAGPPDQRRFGRLTIDQISRPYAGGKMFYQPQDKFYIFETGQVVEVVMTPDAAYKVNGSELTLTAGLTGNTTTRTAAGTVVVRCIEPVNFIAPSSSYCYFLGRTIWESQPVETQGYQNDDVYDFNFVEHKELTIEATNDQLEYINMNGKFNDFSELQAEALEQFKTSIDVSCVWGERAINVDQTGRPTHHMRGLIHAIQTNITTYSPASTVDFENLTSEWMYKQVFRYQGQSSKVVYAGAGWINNFNQAFKEYRRSDINMSKQTPGLNISTYEWMGYKISIIRSELFRMGTPQEHWAVAFDPSVIEPRINKNFDTFDPTLPNERVKKWTVEWAATISFNLEEHLALMRTP